jgi:hypothetical protein
MKQTKCRASAFRSQKKQGLINLFLAAALLVPLHALMAAGPAPVNLGSTAQFAILSGSGITTAGQAYTINGNIGTSPAAGSYEIDVVPANVNGIIYEVSAGGPAGAIVDPTLLTQATGDLTTAYNDAAGRTSTPTAPVILNPGAAGNIGGVTLAPGLYKFTTSPASISESALTLMGTGGSNDVWIFQCAAGLTVDSSVVLAGGAQAGNIFWQIGTSATIGTGVAFQGTILAAAAITMDTTSTLVGRALAGTAVTFDGSSLTVPAVVAPVDMEGSLEVTLTPSAVVGAGAEWQVVTGTNLGTAQDSATILTNVPAGNYTISFTSIAGWNTPSNQIVTVTDGAVATATGLYTPVITPASGLILLTNGDGIIKDGSLPKDLVVDRKYTVTAVAAAKNIFSNWVGGTSEPYAVLSTSARYTFTMTSNLLLEANFVTNPFVPGVYNGLFSLNSGVTEQTAGMLKGLTVRQNGTYSGGLLINGENHAIGGSFDLSGQASNHINRADSQGGPLVVELTLNWNESPAQVTGMVSGTTNGVSWTATNLMADLATNDMPAAEYTILLLPDTNNAPGSSPGGDGYALVTNTATAVRITGALADGTAINQTTPLSQDGFVPVYANLYSGKGLLLGWINLDLANTNATASTGLTWIHPERASGLYPKGFTNILLANQILISPWTNSPANTAALANLSLLDTSNDTNVLESYTVAIKDGILSGAGPVTGSINPRTGFFKVSIGSGANKVTCYGAVLLNGSEGGGYYLTKTNAQGIELKP